jgi:uncharacterized repeat protein (TIGR03803 family)
MRLTSKFRTLKLSIFLLLIAACTLLSRGTHAQSFTDLRDFTLTPDGHNPTAIVQGTDGSIYGFTQTGGWNGNGVFFKVDTGGTDCQILSQPPAAMYCTELLMGPDGRIYGLSNSGGTHGYGFVFRIDTTGANFTQLYAFTGGTDVGNPVSIVISPDQHIFGISTGYGAKGEGALFKMTLSGSGYTLIHSFTSAHGYQPTALVMGTDGNLYGTCESGGSHSDGTIWMSTSSGAASDIYSLTSADGSAPDALVQAGDGALYGTVAGGLFRVTTAGKYTYLHSMSYLNNSHLTVAGNNVYGVEWDAVLDGSVFAYNVSTGTFSEPYAFPSGSYIAYDAVSLFVGADGRLYGASYYNSVPGDQGAVYALNTNGTGFTYLYQFVGDKDTAYPYQIVQAANGTLYGITGYGSVTGGYGLIFAIQPDGSGYSVVSNFTSYVGNWANFLLGPGGNIYVWMPANGANNAGQILVVNSNGSMTPIYSFTTASGSTPAWMVYASDGNFYGLANAGGANKTGVLFKLATDGSGYTVLHTFGAAGDGKNPVYISQGRDGNLYGVTYYGGTSSGYGTVFSYNPVTKTYTRLKSLAGGSAGAYPATVILSSDGNLYGITAGGGSNGFGVAFRLTLAGVYQALTSLPSGFEGGSLIDGGKGVLYGLSSTSGGGGTLYSLNVAGASGVYAPFVPFSSGGSPVPTAVSPAGLLIGSDGAFYGVMNADLDEPYGRVFRYVAAPEALSGVSLSVSSISAGGALTGKVTLTQAAPTGGITVALSCNSAAVTVPASVTVAPGATTASFAVMTSAAISTVATATVTGTYSGASQTAALTVNPVQVQSVGLSAATVTAGGSVTGTVTLTNPPPAGGVIVTLSGQATGVTYPASLRIGAGTSTGTFTISTSATLTSATTVTVGASCNGSSQTNSLTVNPESVSSVSLNATNVTAGKSVTATVNLSQPAPSSGVVVTLSGQVSGVSYPASVTVASGKSTGTFTITTSSTTILSTTTVGVSASINGGSQSVTLTVQPSVSFKVAVSPSTVQGGATSTATVTLAAAAPAGGLSFTLTSSNASVVSFQAPSITIAAGKTTGTATIKTTSVSANTSVTITATLGTTSQTASLKVTH